MLLRNSTVFTVEDYAGELDEGEQTDAIFLDFSKAPQDTYRVVGLLQHQ